MPLNVVGAGFGRTGTLTLKSALETLGFNRCYHMVEVHNHEDHRKIWSSAQRGETVDWAALFEGYRAAVDWPACNFWEQLSTHYPDSRIILSQRDPDRWYESVRNTIYPTSAERLHSNNPSQQAIGRWLFEIIWDGVFGGRIEDKDHAIAIYLAHGERVKAVIPPQRLLVFEPSQGWNPLAEFLDQEVPAQDFPHVNTTQEFQSRRGLISPRPDDAAN